MEFTDAMTQSKRPPTVVRSQGVQKSGRVRPQADIAFLDVVVAWRVEWVAQEGILEAVANIVVAPLQANAGDDRGFAKAPVPSMRGVQTEDIASVEILKLIAEVGVFQEFPSSCPRD